MSCLRVTNIKEAEQRIPSSVFPISGLRRDTSGDLTNDAITIIIDGLKSRGIDPTNTETKQKLIADLKTLLCSVNNQYQYLLQELFTLLDNNKPISDEMIDIIKDKNIFMQDILNVSRHISELQVFDKSKTFIEGWQNTVTVSGSTKNDLVNQLIRQLNMLEDRSYSELQKQRVDVTGQQNTVASNYLGLYGFLNIMAVGLLIYIAASPKL
jgi:hypothetical protein